MNKTELEIEHKFSIGEIVYPIFTFYEEPCFEKCDYCTQCKAQWFEEFPVATEGIAFSYFPNGAELDGYILANHPSDLFDEKDLFRTEEEAKAECDKRNKKGYK